jgi:hypothetical protein
MAIVNQLSTNAVPILHPQTAGQLTGQNVEKIQRLITITNGNTGPSLFLLGELTDTAVVDSIIIEGPAATLTGANDNDIGLYDMNGVVKNGNCYGDAIDLTSAGTAGGDNGGVTWKGCNNRAPAGVFTATTINQQVWQDAGDVEGPFPAVGSTLKLSKYQLGLLMNASATATAIFLITTFYRKTP